MERDFVLDTCTSITLGAEFVESFCSRKVWHNGKQEYDFLNINVELSRNKLCEQEENKWIICDRCIVEARGKFYVLFRRVK